jgi:hypothetical protein
MLDPSHLTPDRMPLREALRALRHVMRRSGRTLRNAAPTDVLPPGASRLAERVLRDVDDLARTVDGAASGIAARVLGDHLPANLQLQSLTGQPEAAKAFATAVYSALRAALGLLGAEEAYISEAAARRAYEQSSEHPAGDGEMAAALALALGRAKVIRDASAEDGARVPGPVLEAVAVFAVLLWLLSKRSLEDDDAALEAAVNLSVAIADDVGKAMNEEDAAGLARLFEEFADHV